MLSYEDFKKEYFSQLQKELMNDDITLTPAQMLKVNGNRDGITVKYPNSNVAPVVYIDEDYQEHRILEKPVNILAKEKAKEIRSLKNQVPDMPQFTWDRDRLYACVVNRGCNEDLLRDVPHHNVEDLSIIVRYKVNEESSLLINNAISAEQFKMTSEELLQVARDNIYKQGYQCHSLTSMINEFMREAGASDEYLYDMQTEGPEKGILVLTNSSKVDGSALCTDKRVLSEIHDKYFGEDFYILPSSRHEVLLVPESTGLEKDDLREMVQSVNAAVVDSRDFLSDNIYECKGPEMVLTLAGKDMEVEKEPVMEKFMSHSR